MRWLGAKAEEAGVEVFPGFAAYVLLLDGRGGIAGVATGDLGLARDGSRKDTFARGVELRARATLLAEGCRGSLSEARCLGVHHGAAGTGGSVSRGRRAEGPRRARAGARLGAASWSAADGRLCRVHHAMTVNGERRRLSCTHMQGDCRGGALPSVNTIVNTAGETKGPGARGRRRCGALGCARTRTRRRTRSA